MRVYLAVSWDQLEQLSRGPVVVPAGHAVTEEVRAELPGAGDEELEYAALGVAAADAIALVTPDRPRRVVLAADLAAVPTGNLSEVRLDAAVRLADLAAVHVDAPEAAADVTSAAGTPADHTAVERALDHELGWYGVQELGGLLG